MTDGKTTGVKMSGGRMTGGKTTGVKMLDGRLTGGRMTLDTLTTAASNPEPKKSGVSPLKKIFAVFVLALSAALQFTVMRDVSLLGIRPNLLLVAAATAGFTMGGEAGGLAGFCLGLYQDAQSGKTPGMYALFYLYAGAAAGLIAKRVRFLPLPVTLVGVFLITFASEALTYLFAYTIPVLRSGLTPGVNSLRAAAGIILPASFLNMLMCIPYYILFKNRRAGANG